MAATRADRTEGNYTVFQNGVYTACEPCKDDPKKPPLWQVKGARIIHDQTEKMMYFEDARLEFFGVPMAYLPVFLDARSDREAQERLSDAELTSTHRYGVGVEVPYYWALAPDYDVTITPTITTRQGLLVQGELRQRLMDGAYQIRASGIFSSTRRLCRHSPATATSAARIETKGQFALNDKWVWGWDGVLMTDYYFFSDYRLAQYRDPLNPFLSLPTEAISQLYLTGRRRPQLLRRALDLLSTASPATRTQVPVIHPVMDYKRHQRRHLRRRAQLQDQLDQPAAQQAEFDPITTLANTDGLCTQRSRRSVARTPSNCLLRGIAGTYTRLSARGGVAAHVHRPYRADDHAVRGPAWRRRRCRRCRTSRALRTS